MTFEGLCVIILYYYLYGYVLCCQLKKSLTFFFLGRQSGREKKLIREPAGSAQPGDHRGLSARVSRGPSSARADTPCYCRSARRSETVYIPWLCYCGCAAEGPVRLTELINRLMFPRWRRRRRLRRRRWWRRSVFRRFFVGGWQNCRIGIGWQFDD